MRTNAHSGSTTRRPDRKAGRGATVAAPMRHALRISRLVAASVLALLVTLAPAQGPSDAAADRARMKIESIIAGGDRPHDPRSTPARTVLTEAEINAYLQVHGHEHLPDAITEPQVRLGDDHQVRVRAIVDLDGVRRARPRDWRDPLAYVAGAAEVIATGRVTEDGGFARAELDGATIAGLPIPSSVVQELLRFFTATSDDPGGFVLDRPFPLPADLRGFDVRRGHVTLLH